MKRILKRAFITMLLVVMYQFVNGTTYYFSSVSGDDSRSTQQATNPSTPWKSIDKLNTVIHSLRPGDQVLFKRGEVFFGRIVVETSGSSGAPIVFGAFGSGDKPIITSLVRLTNWSSLGNGIYEASHSSLTSDNGVNIVLMNEQPQEMGRYPNSDAPNKGYLHYESFSGNSSITDRDLSAPFNFAGGEVVIRKINWVTDRHRITSHSGTTIHYETGNSRYNPTNGYGYFIQNHIGTLDKQGEWFYNVSSKRLSVFFGSSNPSNSDVQVATHENIIYSRYKNNIVIENLHLKGANETGIYIEGGTDVKINNVTVEYAGNTGVKVWNAPEFVLENSHISYSYNNGVDLGYSSVNSIVRNNRVENTHIFPGMGENGDSKGIGIFSKSNNSLVEFNHVINVGYSGIYFGGNSTTVKNNYVNNFCLVKGDGGGIYTYTGPTNTNYTNRKVLGNIVVYGDGAKESTSAWNSEAYRGNVKGIFLDDNSSGVEISDNTIAHINMQGINIHNARDLVIRNNTVYDARAQLVITSSHYGNDPRNIRVIENNFFSKYQDQPTVSITSIKNDINAIADFERNFHIRPFDNGLTIFNQFVDNSGITIAKTHDPQSFQQMNGKDFGAKVSPVEIPLYKVNRIIGDNLIKEGSFLSRIISNMYCYANGGRCDLNWISGILNGGSVQVKAHGLSNTVVPVGQVSRDKYYILKFVASTEKQASLRVFLRNSGREQVSKATIIKLTPGKKEYEVLIQSEVNNGSASIEFETGASNLTYWMDDIFFAEADVEISDPEDYIRFEYNTGNSNKSVSLDGTFVDEKNVTYSGNINLGPYESKVLIRTSASIPAPANQAPTIGITSPSNNTTFTSSSDIEIKVDAKDPDGSVTKVEFFNGSTLIGTSTTAPFTFLWKNAPSGNHSLTAKATDNESASTTSSAIVALVSVSEGSGGNDNNDPPVGNNPGAGFELYLNTGSNNDVNFEGNTFLGDVQFSSYHNNVRTFDNADASNQALFQSERFSEVNLLTYDIPVPNGTYTVKTYHNELWYGLREEAGPGRRVYSIEVEGVMQVQNFDLYVENQNQPIVHTYHSVTVTDGVLNIKLESTRNRASISGIAIVGGDNTGETGDPSPPVEQPQPNPETPSPNNFTAYYNTGSNQDVEMEGKLFLGDVQFGSYHNNVRTFDNRDASNEPLFQSERFSEVNELKYAIPVPNGTYTVKTYHNELWYGLREEGGPGRRVYSIEVEGVLQKENMDLFLENNNNPISFTYNDIVITDGVLDIRMVSTRNRASISGISIEGTSQTPDNQIETPATASAVYLNTGSNSDVSFQGNNFVGDSKFNSYFNVSNTFTNPAASSDVLYQTERNATTLSYSIPVPNGLYTVKTYHNELWWGKAGPSAMAGRRVFDISIEGQRLKQNFDFFVESGNKPIEMVFENIEVKDGFLNIDMVASRDRASVSGIAILGDPRNSVALNPANLRISTVMEDVETVETYSSEYTSNPGIKLYPNPASQKTTISFNLDVKLYRIRVYNMNGQLVRDFEPDEIRGEVGGELIIPLTGIPQGVYLVSLVGEKEMIKQMRLIIKPQ